MQRHQHRRSWTGLNAVLFWLVLCVPAMAIGPDETGMVPGDAVLGNITNFPGHAGIYIGKWDGLPARLKTQYKKAFDDAIIRSRDHGLKTSFLVVDSMGGKGVRVRSFAEQFTGYMPTGQNPTLKNALHWEARSGSALRWPSLTDSDERRWLIVEEALKAAVARIPYDGSHMQRATMAMMPEVREGISLWQEGIKSAKGQSDYSNVNALDCIALVHVAYWRGARIDLDVSWTPWHTPEQLYTFALNNNIRRTVDLEPVYMEAAISGLWDLKIRTLKAQSEGGMNIDVPIWIQMRDKKIYYSMVEKGAAVPPKTLSPLEGHFSKSADGVLHLVDDSQNSSNTQITLKTLGLITGQISGVDDDGPFRVTIEVRKRMDYLNVR